MGWCPPCCRNVRFFFNPYYFLLPVQFCACVCLCVQACVCVCVHATANSFNPLQIYDVLFFFHFLVSVPRLCHLHSTPFIRLFSLTTEYNSDRIYVAGKCKVMLPPPPPPPPAAFSVMATNGYFLRHAAPIFPYFLPYVYSVNLFAFTATEMHDSASLLLSRATLWRLRQMVHFGFSTRHKLNRG